MRVSTSGRPPRRLSKWKKVSFIVVANVLTIGGLFLVGEVVVRWRYEGGLGAAIASIFGFGQDRGYGGSDKWIVHDPELGYKLNPARKEINSRGIRHAELGPVKPAGLFRIIFLGDSVAAAKDGFVTMLGERIDKDLGLRAEVINAAVPGYTTYQERTLLERELLSLQPDLVVLQYCLNDNHKFLHRLTANGAWLVTPESKRAALGDGNGWLDGLTRPSYLLMMMRLRLYALSHKNTSQYPWQSNTDFSAAWKDETWPTFETHLAAMNAGVERTGGRFALVAFPLNAQLDHANLNKDRAYTLKPQRKLTEIAKKVGVPMLDLHPVFEDHRDQDLFGDALHLTEAGHKLAAQHILQFLEDHGLLRSPVRVRTEPETQLDSRCSWHQKAKYNTTAPSAI